MATSILGIGTCSPDNRVSQAEAFESAQKYCGGTERQKRALKLLYSRATIEKRGVIFGAESFESQDSVRPGKDFFPLPLSSGDLGPSTSARMIQYEREISVLAFSACARAFDDARERGINQGLKGIEPSDITSLVTVSCTGFSSPGLDIQIINELGLNRSVSRSHIGFMGCHGGLNGLRVADALVKSLNQDASDGASKSGDGFVLLCAAEICSIHFHYGWNSDNLLANSLFADGSAALIMGRSRQPDDWVVRASASYVVPQTLDAMSWKIKDDGFAMTLSPSVPDLIQSNLAEWLTGWLNSIGMKIGDIQAWAVHPGGVKILEAVANSLALDENALRFSYDVLHEFGNMSSPTVFFILQKIRNSVGCVPTVSLAFGPGLTIEAAYLSV